MIAKTVPSLILGLLVVAAPAGGAERILRLDPRATEIRFTLGATLHTVEGTVSLRAGEIRFDPGTGEASGRVVVDAASADTGNDRRDRDMHRKVLESGRYPEIVFFPERLGSGLDAGGGGTVTLAGRLEIHGGSHLLEIPAEVTVEGGRLTARATFAVPYVEWGMEDPSTLFLRVDKEVEVTVLAVGTLQTSLD